MIKVTDKSFDTFISSGEKIKILKLGATWCSPCQAAVPPCNELSKEMESEIEIGELDIEESPNAATSLNCRGVPLFVKFKDGQQISQKVGWPGKQQLKEWIKENS
jgi:thioredoxin 1